MLFAILTLVLFSAVIQADPTTPSWPSAFSATVFHQHTDSSNNMQQQQYRWFYDEVEEAERYDSQTIVDEEYATEQRYVYWDHSLEYTITKRSTETECYYGAINGTTLPIPTFDQYTYVETIYKNNRKVYHWTYTDSVNNLVEDYYDTADTEQDPVLFVVTDNTNISVDTHYYTEFDTCQMEDEDIFVIPELILEVCNAA